MRQSSRRGLLALLAAVLILALLALGLLVFRRFQAEAPAAPSASPAETLPAAATPVPDTPSPSPTEDPVSVRAREILAGMDDREKICQLFVVYPDDIAGVGSITYAGEETRLGLERYPVGGLVYAQGNILSREAVTEMIRTQQSWSQIPLLTCVDEEGGRVTRVMGNLDTTWLDACTLTGIRERRPPGKTLSPWPRTFWRWALTRISPRWRTCGATRRTPSSGTGPTAMTLPRLRSWSAPRGGL